MKQVHEYFIPLEFRVQSPSFHC